MFERRGRMARLGMDASTLAAAPLPGDAAGIVEELRVLEEIKCAAEARQARLAHQLDRFRQAEQAPSAAHLEVALARRISPHRGRQALSLARYLASDLPHTKAAFDAGRISEWRATLIARETSCLQAEPRAAIDELVSADPDALSRRGDREIVSLCRHTRRAWTQPPWPRGDGARSPSAGSAFGRHRTRWST